MSSFFPFFATALAIRLSVEAGFCGSACGGLPNGGRGLPKRRNGRRGPVWPEPVEGFWPPGPDEPAPELDPEAGNLLSGSIAEQSNQVFQRRIGKKRVSFCVVSRKEQNLMSKVLCKLDTCITARDIEKIEI